MNIKDIVVNKPTILATEGRVRFEANNGDELFSVSFTFEAINQIYDKIKPHLEWRKLEGIMEGQIDRGIQ